LPKNALGIDVCVERMKNALREVNLGSTEKASKLALFAKNVKEMLKFAKMNKN
jgi:hypothetical protein